MSVLRLVAIGIGAVVMMPMIHWLAQTHASGVVWTSFIGSCVFCVLISIDWKQNEMS